MKTRIFIFAFLTAAAFAQAPALPYFDWGACPFEGCAYRRWSAQKDTTVYNTWHESRRAVAHVAKGEIVTGLRGVVITFQPGVIKMDRDLPEQKLQRGDTILTYTYRGEGFSAAWVKGRFESDFDISFTKWPDGGGCGGTHCAATYVDMGKKVWWAEVKLKSGRTGWVNTDEAQFNGMDMLGPSEEK